MSTHQYGSKPASIIFIPAISVLRTRKYQLIIVGSAIVYAFVYMFAVGIISYYPGFTQLEVDSPIIRASSNGITIIPMNYVFIFMFYSTITFLLISAFLVGLNTTLLFYSRNIFKICNIKTKNLGTHSFVGILPTFFTSFACCGGGFMALLIGPAAFSSLSLIGNYLAPLTIIILIVGTVLTSIKISKSYGYRFNDRDRFDNFNYHSTTNKEKVR